MHGVSALVVEEEYLIAADIEQTLRAAGAAEVKVFRNIAELRERPTATGEFNLAVIEAKLGHPDVVAFATSLNQAGVPVVVTSADRAIQTVFKGAVGLEKPFDTASLLAACRRARETDAPSPPELR